MDDRRIPPRGPLQGKVEWKRPPGKSGKRRPLSLYRKEWKRGSQVAKDQDSRPEKKIYDVNTTSIGRVGSGRSGRFLNPQLSC